MEYCCHVWACAPNCLANMLDKLQKRECSVVGPPLAASLEPLARQENVISVSLSYRHYFKRCSSGIGGIGSFSLFVQKVYSLF